MISNALTVLAAAEPRTPEELQSRSTQVEDLKWQALLKQAVDAAPGRLRLRDKKRGELEDTKKQFYVTRFADGFFIGTRLGAPFNFEASIMDWSNLPETVRSFVEMLGLATERQDKILSIADEYRDRIMATLPKTISRQTKAKLARQLNRVQEAVNDTRA
jgi:hypothetical protein